MIKLFKPYMTWSARFQALKTLFSSQIAEGPKVKKLEEEFAKTFHLKEHNCVAVNSGTAALELAYELIGLGRKDEVITTPMTAVATNIPLIRRKVQLVFADITPQFVLDPEDVKRKITKRTKAIVYVDYGGRDDTLIEIAKIAHDRGISLVHDCAQSILSFRPIGDYLCFSFQAIKPITGGDGGMLVVSTEEIEAHRARRLRWFGFNRDVKRIFGDSPIRQAGFKYHMNDITASLILGNLKSFKKIRKKMLAFKQMYERSGFPVCVGSWLCILICQTDAQKRKIQMGLAKRGIQSLEGDKRNDSYEVFGGKRALYHMDLFEKKVTLLPMYPSLSKRSVKKIIKGVWNSLRE